MKHNTVDIVEPPSPANGQTLRIRIEDAQVGAEWYEVSVKW